jgi:hypothetical protein
VELDQEASAPEGSCRDALKLSKRSCAGCSASAAAEDEVVISSDRRSK